MLMRADGRTAFDPSLAVEDAWRYNVVTYAQKISRLSARRKDWWMPYRWLRYVMNVIQPMLLAGNARIVVMAPPRHGKTEGISRWISTWFLDLFPEKRVVLAGYGEKLPKRYGLLIRDAFSAEPFTALTMTRIRPDKSEQTDWMTTAGGGLRAIGVGSGFTGHGADFLNIDDPIKDWEEAKSQTYRDRIGNWMDWVTDSRMEPGGSVVLTMTRWHQDDPAGRIMKIGGWTVIRLPALAEDDDPIGREVDEPLCPERYGYEHLAGIRRRKPRVFAGQYQQRPSPAEGNIIKRAWLRYYRELPSDLSLIKHSWDMNFGKKKPTKKHSFVCGTTWGKQGNSRIYLMDHARGKWQFTQALPQIIALAKRWPSYHELLIEDAANGTATKDVLEKVIPRMIAVGTRGESKESRLEAVSPFWEAGNILLPAETLHPWVSEYVEELVTFPASEKDDQVDSTSQALARYKSEEDFDDVEIDLSIGVRRRPMEFLT